MSYRPQFYDLKDDAGSASYLSLIEEMGPVVVDRIEEQVLELLLCWHPDKRKEDIHKMDMVRKELFQFGDASRYGVWVYYPWNNTVVHLLKEDDFITVRTNRNKYKITANEQEQLAKKSIGIAGLSVGRSVAITSALERIAGEIRLADFDELELSNLNRIKAPLTELGVNKSVSAAREIAEIDPYINVVCFEDGLTEENMDAFFTQGGKLDLFIEECDDIKVKIISRLKAKALHIPVLMETSDNCVVDIERFDLEPQRPIIHGQLEGLDLSKVSDLKSQEDKLPYITRFSGLETLSPRMKSSMIEIERTIRTWPQLASDVTYGSGVVTKIANMILLDQFHKSGRYFADIGHFLMDEATSDPHESEKPTTPTPAQLANTIKLKGLSAGPSLDEELLNDLIRDSLRGTTLGNLQMFQWLWVQNNLYLVYDRKRGSSFSDMFEIGSKISLGAVLEALAVGARYRSKRIKVEYYPFSDLEDVVAKVSILDAEQRDEMADINYKMLYERFTNRSRNYGGALDALSVQKLSESLDGTGLKLHLIQDKADLEHLAEVIAEIDRLRIQYPKTHADLFNELRFPKSGGEILEGINIDDIELTLGERIGFVISKDKRTHELLNELDLGEKLGELTREFIASSSGFGILTVKKDKEYPFLEGGRAVQRFWMDCHKYNISMHPFTALMFFDEHLKRGTIDEPFKSKILDQVNKAFDYFSIQNDESVIFVFRLMPITEEVRRVKSKRRGLQDVLHIER